LNVFDILELWHDKSKEVEEQSKENGINIVYQVIKFIKWKAGKAAGFFTTVKYCSLWRRAGEVCEVVKKKC